MTKTKDTKINPIARIILMIIGFMGAVYLLVLKFNIDNLPITITVMGVNITEWGIAIAFVLLAILFHSLLSSGVTGKQELDT